MRKVHILFLLFFSSDAMAHKKVSKGGTTRAAAWLPSFDVTPANFQKPAQSFGPMEQQL
jgi:hypothetical protein